MLIGGYGPDARAVVERATRRGGMEPSHDDLLTLAAPKGSLHCGEAGSWRVWIAGRLDVSDFGEELGPSRRTAADTAAAALQCLGETALARFYGAYVLVAVDRSRGKVLVSHDHLGARSLTYTRRGEQVLFAEHLVDLLELLPATPPPNRLAVVQWLDRRSLPLGRSLFSGIDRLPAGHALEMSERAIDVVRFWRPIFREPQHVARDESAAFLRAAAFTAVNRAAEGLKQPAVQLSGGIDSACVAAGLSKRRGGKTIALARTFPGYPDVDESWLIEQTPETAQVELVTLPYSETPIFPPVLDYITRWSLPPSSVNTAVWRPLMDAARARGVDGLLDGEGGDELFGVQPYLIADELRNGRLLASWRLTGQLPGIGDEPSTKLRLRVLRRYGISSAAPRHAQTVRRRLRGPRAGLSPLVREEDARALVERDERWTWKRGDGPLWWSAAVDSLLHDIERLDISGDLRRVSLDSQLDRRHPFTHDARLIEAVLSISPELQFDSVRDRPLLRDGLVGLIPEQVRTRYAKSYFNELSVRSLAGAEGAGLLGRISSTGAPVRAYVREDVIDEISALRRTRGIARYRLADMLFRLATIDSWLRHLSDGAVQP